MADLRELAKQKGVTLPKDAPPAPSITESDSPIITKGKRRPWLEPEISTVQKANGSIKDQTTATPSVEEPFKYRLNTVEAYRLNTVEEPLKNRLEENEALPEYRLPNRLTSGEEPFKNRLNTVEKMRSIQTLAGKQKATFFFLVSEAKENGSWTENDFRLTPQISSIRLAQATMAKTYESIRGVTNALKRAQLLKRQSIKKGPGGFTVYAIPKAPYLEALNYLSRLNTVEEPLRNRLNTVDHTVYQTVESLSSSSSNLLNKNTTTTQGAEKFEFKLDQVSEFGLTASAVSRCFELYPNLENEKMQDLLNRFAQYMRSGDGKRVQNARGFFISLAEQMSKGMTPLDHIETAEAILMRELVIKKRAQKAEQELLEKEMQDFDFEDWWSELLPQDRDALIPPNNIALPGSSSQKLLAKQVHAEKFWFERKKRALDSGGAEV